MLTEIRLFVVHQHRVRFNSAEISFLFQARQTFHLFTETTCVAHENVKSR